jgi:hypothetical protein
MSGRPLYEESQKEVVLAMPGLVPLLVTILAKYKTKEVTSLKLLGGAAAVLAGCSLLRTSTRPTLNRTLLLRASV